MNTKITRTTSSSNTQPPCSLLRSDSQLQRELRELKGLESQKVVESGLEAVAYTCTGYFRKVNQDRFCIATFPSSLNCP
eukprot:CAMPEP_0175173300 /NCGR_PEP_ID=MMETSP0087-20121206/31965_1 /TAXON_ID=136419 /ORGANISM="Unknown Unknown, Strain D1" /LENGTH=78 /DNA_ID=CAMNT_0016464573 /DNA_START=52 /DNA_END=284 /DNA_ORIENTATION=-